MERPPLSESLAKVTFDDAAVYFSEEQWQNLEEFQKKIYKELIKEIYETMLALGYRIPKPEIVCRIERGEEPCIDACKKPKPQASPPEGTPAGSKDSEPVIKVERESPEASIPFHPSEISSSQERSAGQCPRCGMYCNNQCGVGYQWTSQGMYTVSPMDRNHGKQYVTPPPPYFNGNPISPGFANNRGEGMSHTTSPRSGYGNVGMVPLSPHYAGYRSAGDHGSQFPVPDRSGNTMYANFDLNQQTQMGPPGSYGAPDHQNRCRKEQYPHGQEASFQDRRNPMAPCPSCGAFCNNQCGMSFQWEQRRLHHPVPGAADGGQGNRYASPPNPYFSGVANSTFPNVRPPVRHGTSPVNVQGNPAMIQLSPQYAGYRRPGDPKSPNVMPGKLEHSSASVPHGNSAPASSPHGQNSYGAIPTNSGGYHRKTQSMSPLAAIETMPMFATNNSPNNVVEQRNRLSAQTVTSSDGNKDRSTVPHNANRRPDNVHLSIQGNRVNRASQQVSPAAGSTGQPKPGELSGNKTSSPSVSACTTARNTQPSSSSVNSQEVGRVAASEGHGVKRAAPQAASDSGLPTKRTSPPIIIVDTQGSKRTSTPSSGGSGQSSVCVTPPTTKAGSVPSTPAAAHGNQDLKKTTPPETKEGRRPTPPITISNIRSAGIFVPPSSRPKKDVNNANSPIIIIDDKDGDTVAPRSSPANATNHEVRSSTSGTPPVTSSKSSGDPPPSTVAKISPQGGQPAAPVVVNKVQVQQPSPIIVTGGTGLANQPLPVNGNQSIMWTFPVTVGSSGIMLATPVNMKQPNRLPISKNPRLVQPNPVPLNATSGNVNAKFSPVAVTSVIGQTNPLPVSVPPGQAKPITVNVNQAGNIGGSLNIRNSNVQKVNNGTLKAVPVTTAGTQPVAQTFPLFVDANSGLILTGSAVPSKDNVSSGIGNATVVTVNGGVVTGNVAPVSLGGKLAFRNITPVNVNKIGSTTFFTVDRAVGIGNGSPVTLTNNAANFNNKGTLSINNPTILTLNGGLPISNPGPVGAPIANIASVNTNGALQMAPSAAPAVVGGGGQQNNGIIIRRVGEPGMVTQQPSAEQAPVVVERLFNCSECGEKFNSLENLASHQSVHKQPGATSDGKAAQPNDKGACENEVLPGAVDEDAPTILYTTQGDDGSTVYVVTV